MAEGTYTILVNLPAAASVGVGALGTCSFPAGWYAYTGSAFGPGGFARVDRHHRTAAGDHDTRHWHVDYLLGETPARIETVVRSVDVDAECAIARAVAAETGHTPVDGFGASDCDCPAHLQDAPDRDSLAAAVRAAHAEHGTE